MSLTMQKPKDDTVVCVLRSCNNDEAYQNKSGIVHQMTPPYKFTQRAYEVGLRKVSCFPNKRTTDNTVKKEGRKVTRVIKKNLMFHEKPISPGPLFPGYTPAQVVKTVPVFKREKEILMHFINRFNEDIGPGVNVHLYSSGSDTQKVVLVKFEPSDVQEILLFSSGLLDHRTAGNSFILDDTSEMTLLLMNATKEYLSVQI